MIEFQTFFVCFGYVAVKLIFHNYWVNLIFKCIQALGGCMITYS